MHPAYSVIFFTTASGAGYGLLFWLGLGEATGLIEGRWLPLIILVVATLLFTAGLLASTFHLGHPERAIGAFSQWRSSWLSREGVAAVATYLPAGLLGLCYLFGITGMLPLVAGLAAALLAAVTVYCTGMIYGSLRTIRHWARPEVPWIYLFLAAGTGGLLLALLQALGRADPRAAGIAGALGLALAALIKLRYWAGVDADPGRYTAAMALGLKGWDQVTVLDPPHTKPNFVMREMGYSVGRKHAATLRDYVLYALFGVPALLLLAAFALGGAALFLLLAVVSAGLGVLLERWLFFAEAEHVSMLYYGRDRA